MPEHKHIEDETQFAAKHKEMKDKWMNLSSGNILAMRCNHCKAKHGFDFFNTPRAWIQYNEPCACHHTDKSIMILVPKTNLSYEEE